MNLQCAECEQSNQPLHAHDQNETYLVSGKFVVAEEHCAPVLIATLEDLFADQAYVAMTQLHEDLGDHARARRDQERWEDLERAIADTQRAVRCSTHGPSPPAYVCRHHVTGQNLGFVTDEQPNAEFPDAWCDDCERIRLAEDGEWNDRSEAFANVTMLCSHCYVVARERNRERRKQ